MESLSYKQQALIATAYDFYHHSLSGHIQYDQRSMDRVLQLTPRRRKYLPPEAGTSQNTLHLDCSGFCFAAYYQTFGFELPSDLTWHMMTLLKPRVYYYERTYNETAEDRARIAEEFLSCLQPGDLINMLVQGNGGHIMMYIGDGQYLHCTSGPGRGIDYSYDYSRKKNQDRPSGGIRLDLAKYLVTETPEGEPNDCHYFFEPKWRSIGISRPLELVGDVTPQAEIRLNQFHGLWAGVESTHPGAHHAVSGGAAEYQVILKNLSEESKDAQVTFKAAGGSHLVGANKINIKLQAGEEKTVRFPVVVDADYRKQIKLEGPEVAVNDLNIWTQPILLGNSMETEEVKWISSVVKERMACGADAVKAAAEAYGQFGIEMESRKEEYLFTHFCLHDAVGGTDVVSRRPQNPHQDLAVYSYFGGTGVITPEMGSSTGIRTTRISMRDLMAGDIILCSNDVFGKRSYACFYDGESLTGSFDAGEDMKTITGEEMAAFVDSLFGRFCWIMLRPWLGK